MRNIFSKRVECGIGVAPWIDEFFGIEPSDESCDFGEFEKARARWNQQADRELYGRYGRDEITIGDGFEKIEVARARSPWREWDKGRLQRETSVVAKIESTEEIYASVTLFEFKKDVIVERFDGARDKQAASARECGKSASVAEKVFDFLSNVGEDYFVRDHTKLAGVNRNDWAVAAEMFAAAGRFRVTGNAMRAGGQYNVSVFAKDG